MTESACTTLSLLTHASSAAAVDVTNAATNNKLPIDFTLSCSLLLLFLEFDVSFAKDLLVLLFVEYHFFSVGAVAVLLLLLYLN